MIRMVNKMYNLIGYRKKNMLFRRVIMKKRMFMVFLATALVVGNWMGAASIKAKAVDAPQKAEPAKKGSTGEGAQAADADFVVDENGVLTEYKGEDKVVVIPDGVKEIGVGAFCSNQIIEKIVLPDSVTYIGLEAFLWCDNLKIVEAKALKVIGAEAFFGCGLEEIDLSHVDVIGDEAFGSCKHLKEVDLRAVKKIGNWAFMSSTDLAEICLESVEEIGDKAFYNCSSLSDVTGLTHLKLWGDDPFGKTPFAQNYGEGKGENPMLVLNGILVFAKDCSGKVTVPDTVVEIGGGAFAGSAVTHVVIPDTVKKIGRGAFADTELVSVNIPDGIKLIDNNTFARTKKLTEIVLPDSVEEIGDEAFAGSGLSSIKWPGKLKMIGEKAFWGTQLVLVQLPKEVEIIRDWAFASTNQLKSFSMQDSVVKLGMDLFEGSNLQDIRLSNGLEEMDFGVFAWCSNLQSLTLPASLKEVNSGIFYGTRGARTLTVPAKVTEEVLRAFHDDYNRPRVIYTTKLIPGSDLEKFVKERGWAVAELALTTEKVSIWSGTKFALRFSNGAKAEKWSSSNKKVVTVDRVGNLYAKGAGTAVITATIYGETYRCEVVVK